VLATAVAQVAAWSAQGARLHVAVNLAPRWLQHSDVADTVAEELARHGVPASLLRLEITENMVLDSSGVTLPALHRLREMGIGLSLDDFGTGYSSMTHLRLLPVDQLKVDRGFVQAMTTCAEDAVIVRAAVELGRNLGMEVVAEGIEDAETLAEVVASGCGRAQGYYFSKPLPADELETWADEKFPTWRAVKPVRV
jgi:EAL domain-containing protein (putative c-di-GMP-specific phosphodiesterase class I)